MQSAQRIEYREPESPPRVRERLAATHRAVAGAADAHVHAAIAEVAWQRRGMLGRLSKTK
jgi:hypothetical protein